MNFFLLLFIFHEGIHFYTHGVYCEGGKIIIFYTKRWKAPLTVKNKNICEKGVKRRLGVEKKKKSFSRRLSSHGEC